MLPTNRVPTHPGEILREEFLVPLGITDEELAAHLRVPTHEIAALTSESASITPAMAWLLSMAFDMSPQFWMNLQSNYALVLARPKKKIAAWPRPDLIESAPA